MEQSQDGRIEFIVVGLVILFAILLLFGKKRKHTNSPLGSNDRMLEKYKDLIGLLMEGHNDSQIMEMKEKSIKFGVSNAGGRTIFELIEVDTILSIVFEGSGVEMGTIKKRWVFNPFQNPQEILLKMNNDIGELIMSKYQ